MTQFQLGGAPAGPDPKRLLMAVFATSLVLMVYSYFFAPVPAPLLEKSEPSIAINSPDEDKEKTEHKPALNLHAEATPQNIPVVLESFVHSGKEATKNRISYQAKMSSRGAIIESFVLSDFSKPKVLFDAKNNDNTLLGLYSKNASISLKEDALYTLVKKDEHSITFRHVTPQGLSIVREYHFLENASIKEQITIKNLSNTPIKAEMALSLKNTKATFNEPGLLNPGVQGENIVVKSAKDYQKYPYKDLLKEAKTISNFNYLAFDDQYFLSAFIPAEQSDIDFAQIGVIEYDDSTNKSAQIDIHLKPIVLLLDEEKIISHKMFLGPKQIDLLSLLSPSLEETVEFGWFSVLCRPMLWLLVRINDFVLNFGLAIILITFLIKLLTYPLTIKSYSSQEEMKKIAPKIKELQKKYSHDRSTLGQKQMELYREHGINPMAGCLPLLIQLPIWFAFYRMLGFSVELFDQPFFGWIKDLTAPDPLYVLPIAMGLSMLLTQALMPPQMDQPQMKYVMWAMPIFFTFIMLNMPAGLSLYILTNNLLTIVQQIIIKKRAEKRTV